MARPLKPFVRSGGYYPSAKYTPLVYPGGYTTLNAKNGKPEPIDTFIGKIARFLAKRSLPMVKLEANFTPIQSLNGQEAPYPPGGGKNKLPVRNATDTWFGGTAVFNDIGTITLTNITTTTTGTKNVISANADENKLYLPAGQYIISCEAFGTSGSYVGVNVNSTSGAYDATSAGYGLFTVPDGGYISVRIRIGTNATIDNITLHPMIRLASDPDDTWKPYYNICPISGHTGCEVYDNGVNQWDEQTKLGNISTVTGKEAASSTSLICDGYIPVKPSTSYYVKTPDNIYLFYYKADKSFIRYHGATIGNAAFTTPDDCGFIRIGMRTGYGTTYNHDISINYPSTDHDYHAFVGTTVSISFGSTVYGGKLTVFEDGSGQIDATYYGHIFDGTETITSAGSGGKMLFRLVAQNIKLNSGDRLCSHFPNASVTTSTSEQGYYSYTTSGGANGYLQFRWTDLFTSVDEFKSYCAAQYAAGTPLTAIAVMTKPITIPLTASQINTLVGENVVWVEGSSGNITVQAFGSPID